MNQSPAPQSKPKISKWLWISLIIVAVLAAGFFAWYYLMGSEKKTETKTTTSTTSSISTTKNSQNDLGGTSACPTSKISFEYPENYSVDQSVTPPSPIIIRSPDPKKSIGISDHYPRADCKKYDDPMVLYQEMNKTYQPTILAGPAELNINGVKAIQWTEKELLEGGPTNTVKYTIFIKDKKIVNIYTINTDISEDYETVVNSLKFL